jgi:hypothetical protein
MSSTCEETANACFEDHEDVEHDHPDPCDKHETDAEYDACWEEIDDCFDGFFFECDCADEDEECWD